MNCAKKYWLSPLYSFNCNCGNTNLNQGIRIIKLPDFLRDDYHSQYKYESQEKYVEWAVSLPSHVSGNISIESDLHRVTPILVELLSSLRLCHKGMVTSGELVEIDMRGRIPGLHRMDYDYDFVNITKYNRPLKPEYEFRKPDIEIINNLMAEIHDYRKSGKLGSLDEALKRFNSSYYGEHGDRLIDQIIAFESLYLKDDKELGYKLALRTAFLLGKQRARIFSDMKKAYDLRGQIVHGNKQVDRSKLEGTVPKTEEYLRQSIRIFLLLLSQGKSLKQIRVSLDENILKNGRVLALRE